MTKRYFLIICVYFFTLLISPFGVALIHNGLRKSELVSGASSMVYTVILWTIITNLSTLFIIWLTLRKQPESNKIALGKKSSLPVSIIWVVVGTFLLIISQSLAVFILSQFTGPISESENTKELLNYTKELPVFLIFISLLGPILEELIFRKVLYGGFSNRINVHLSAVISSAIFAFLHGDGMYFLSYFVIGLILCYLYTKTKRITVSMGAHILMNTLVLLVHLGGS